MELSAESPPRLRSQPSTSRCQEYTDSTVPHGESDITSSARVTWKRPLGLLIVGVMWGIGGIYNIVVSIVLYGPQLNENVRILYPSVWQADISLRLLLICLSVLQLPMAYEVVKGGPWSYFGGLAISAIELAIYADFISLYSSVPLRFGEGGLSLRTPLLFASLGVGTAYAVLIWVYFNIPSVRAYLWRWL